MGLLLLYNNSVYCCIVVFQCSSVKTYLDQRLLRVSLRQQLTGQMLTTAAATCVSLKSYFPMVRLILGTHLVSLAILIPVPLQYILKVIFIKLIFVLVCFKIVSLNVDYR